MDNTINGRTPEEIKNGLECCVSREEGIERCKDCPYEIEELDWSCMDNLNSDALDYIQ